MPPGPCRSRLCALAGPPARLAVVRALNLGDMLCSIPALRAIRAMLPETRITLIGLPWAHELLARFPAYLDEVLPFPGWRGIPECKFVAKRTEAFLTEARGRRLDVALQAHGDGRLMNAFAGALGAKIVAGFSPANVPPPDPEVFLPYREREPEVRRLLRLAEFLGAPSVGEHLEFPLSGDDEAEAGRLQAEHGLAPGSFVVVHPGGRGPERRWSAAGFAHVAETLAARDLRVVLTGTAEEGPLVEHVARGLRRVPVRLEGCTSLGGLAALVRDARLLVCNDTGVSHLAAALRVPSVVVFTGSDPERWAPLDRQLHRPVIADHGASGYARTIEEAASAAVEQADELLAVPA